MNWLAESFFSSRDSGSRYWRIKLCAFSICTRLAAAAAAAESILVYRFSSSSSLSTCIYIYIRFVVRACVRHNCFHWVRNLRKNTSKAKGILNFNWMRFVGSHVAQSNNAQHEKLLNGHTITPNPQRIHNSWLKYFQLAVAYFRAL